MPCPAVITLTSTVPAEWAGEIIVSLVLLITFRPVPGVVPKLTADTVFPAVALSVKWLPLTVTVVPPTEVPDVGEILLMDGREAETGPTIASRNMTAIQNTVKSGRGRTIRSAIP
jgi:hypothetical protein